MIYSQPNKKRRKPGDVTLKKGHFPRIFIFLPPLALLREFMGAMDANMVELAERIPVFAEAQVLPRSTANLSELRMFFPSPYWIIQRTS